MRTPLIIALIISIAFIAIIRMRTIWERHFAGMYNLTFYLLIAILFFWIIIRILRELFRIYKDRKTLTISTFVPLVILLISMYDGLYNPMNINLENLYGNVIFRACYEGTQNQATFKLKEGGEFELHWTGILYNEFFLGTYREEGDTLILKYKDNKPIRFGSKVLMDKENERLVTIRTDGDSLENVVSFYYGACKGLN